MKIIQKNYHNLIENSNEQVKINEALTKQMEKTVDHINLVQEKITKEINQIRENFIVLESEIKMLVLQSEIKNDIDLINDQIETINDIILSSRLEILPKNILKDEEIDRHNITVEAYPFIKCCILYGKDQIVIVISIPNFTTDNYFKMNIEKNPNKDHHELETNIETVITKEKQVYEYPNEKMILEKDLKIFKDNCISNLLNNDNMKCNFKLNTKEEIKQLKNGNIVTKNLKQQPLLNDCHERKTVFIEGNNMIKFRNCKVTIGLSVFENKREEYFDLLPNFKRNITFENLSNENFTLKELIHEHIENTNQIKEVRMDNLKFLHTNMSISITTIVICVIGLILFVYFYRKFFVNRQESILMTLELLST